jgi:hypothetical protein
MTAKARKVADMNCYQQIHYAARNNKSAAEILKLCRVPLDNAMAHDTESGPSYPASMDTLMALWAVAARLNEAERQIETLKRRARRERQRTGGKPKSEFLKNAKAETPTATETPLDAEDNEAFMHAFEKND